MEPKFGTEQLYKQMLEYNVLKCISSVNHISHLRFQFCSEAFYSGLILYGQYDQIYSCIRVTQNKILNKVELYKDSNPLSEDYNCF
jgi:hypothetical protein